MSYSEIKGDLVQMAKGEHFDIIVHGCNCFCTMGSGIAAIIKKEFPEAYAADCCTISGSDKRGSFTWAHSKKYRFTIVNAYTQYNYGAKGDLFDYDGFRRILKQLRVFADPTDRIGFPMIGAGLAGGQWQTIRDIIQDELPDRKVTVVIYEPK